MLTKMRSKTGGIVAKIFIGLLAASFAIWGISDVFRTKVEDTLITAGETRISSQAFQERFRDALARMAQAARRTITPDEARQMGIDRQILVQLIREAVLREAARRLDLSLSDEFIARRVASMPQFRGVDGRFDVARFRQALASAGLTEGQFISEERAALLGNGLSAAVTADMPVPRLLARQVHAHRNAMRDARFVRIVADAAAVPEPDEAALKKFHEENKTLFATPERRVLRVLALLPENFLDEMKVDEAELRQHYEARRDSYMQPERRVVEQVRFDSEEEARKAHEAIRSGALSWEELLKQKNLKPADARLGTFTRESYPDSSMAEKIFALKEGEVSAPIKGALGVFLVRVPKVEPASTKSFQEARAELEKLVKLERARDHIAELYDRIEEARASGTALADIAKELGLKIITTPPVTADGTTEGGGTASLPVPNLLLPQAFRSEVGADNDPVHTDEDGYVWFEVEKIIPPGTAPFEKVREEVKKHVIARQLAERLGKRAEELKRKAESGMSLEDIAREIGGRVESIEKVRRTDARPDFPAPAVAALFSGKPGGFAVAIGPDGRTAWLIRISERPLEKLDPNSTEARAINQVLAQGLAADMGAQFVAALQEAYDVKINQRIWRQLNGGALR